MRTLDPTPGKLRPQTTSFIGREAEAAELQDAVKSHRLVTLTGVGGVGKTRLATEVAAHLAGERPKLGDALRERGEHRRSLLPTFGTLIYVH